MKYCEFTLINDFKVRSATKTITLDNNEEMWLSASAYVKLNRDLNRYYRPTMDLLISIHNIVKEIEKNNVDLNTLLNM